MSDKNFTVLDLLDLDLKGYDSLNLHCLSGRNSLSRKITIPDINRPGLALSGFFESFAYERVQLIGRGEFAYLHKLINERKLESIEKLLSFEIPCIVCTHNLIPNDGISVPFRCGQRRIEFSPSILNADLTVGPKEPSP